MEAQTPEATVEAVIGQLTRRGLAAHRSTGQGATVLGVVGTVTNEDLAVVRELEGVARVVRVTEPFKLASRAFRQSSTVVTGEFGTIGGGRPWIAVEPIGPSTQASGEEDGGPASATLPYRIAAGRSFDACVTRARVAQENGGALACLSLHPSPSSARFPVVFVAREPSWGAETWIERAERELQRKGTDVVLLEAGGEYPSGARTLEVAAIARAKLRTHLPIVVDVPLIAQQARYCTPVACAAVGAGVDGVILRAWVGPDGDPPTVAATLRWDEAAALADTLRAVGAALQR